MKKLTFLIILAIAACAPPVTQGTIKDMKFEPAHWESGYRTEHYQDCGLHYDIYAEEYKFSCEPDTRQVYEEHHEFLPDQWWFFLEFCEEDECRTGWLRVDETDYHRFEVGSYYNGGTP